MQKNLNSVIEGVAQLEEELLAAGEVVKLAIANDSKIKGNIPRESQNSRRAVSAAQKRVSELSRKIKYLKDSKARTLRLDVEHKKLEAEFNSVTTADISRLKAKRDKLVDRIREQKRVFEKQVEIITMANRSAKNLRKKRLQGGTVDPSKIEGEECRASEARLELDAIRELLSEVEIDLRTCLKLIQQEVRSALTQKLEKYRDHQRELQKAAMFCMVDLIVALSKVMPGVLDPSQQNGEFTRTVSYLSETLSSLHLDFIRGVPGGDGELLERLRKLSSAPLSDNFSGDEPIEITNRALNSLMDVDVEFQRLVK